MSDLHWAPQGGMGPEMYPLKHEICHSGPVLNPQKSGVSLSVLSLVLSDLGWVLFGLKGTQVAGQG